MRIEPWQIPVLAMAGVGLLVCTEFVITSHNKKKAKAKSATGRTSTIPGGGRTWALGLLAAVILVLFVWAVGTSTADRLATIASGVAESMALGLAILSYKDRPKSPPDSASKSDPRATSPDTTSSSAHSPKAG
jgi:hypothetical protein